MAKSRRSKRGAPLSHSILFLLLSGGLVSTVVSLFLSTSLLTNSSPSSSNSPPPPPPPPSLTDLAAGFFFAPQDEEGSQGLPGPWRGSAPDIPASLQPTLAGSPVVMLTPELGSTTDGGIGTATAAVHALLCQPDEAEATDNLATLPQVDILSLSPQRPVLMSCPACTIFTLALQPSANVPSSPGTQWAGVRGTDGCGFGCRRAWAAARALAARHPTADARPPAWALSHDHFGASLFLPPHLPRLALLHGPHLWEADAAGTPFGSTRDAAKGTLEQAALRDADCVASPSAYLLSFLADRGITPRPNVPSFVLPNLLGDLGTLGEAAHGSPVDGPRVPIRALAFLGRLETRKGIHLFTAALDILHGHGIPPALQPLPVTWVGKDPPAHPTLPALDARCSAWAPAISCTFVTDAGRPRVLKMLASAADDGLLVVTPSLSENAPYTVAEAAALGAPLVATRVGGIPELLANHSATLVQPQPTALAAAIRYALQHGARRAIPSAAPSSLRRRWASLLADPEAACGSSVMSARPASLRPLRSLLVCGWHGDGGAPDFSHLLEELEADPSLTDAPVVHLVEGVRPHLDEYGAFLRDCLQRAELQGIATFDFAVTLRADDHLLVPGGLASLRFPGDADVLIPVVRRAPSEPTQGPEDLETARLELAVGCTDAAPHFLGATHNCYGPSRTLLSQRAIRLLLDRIAAAPPDTSAQGAAVSQYDTLVRAEPPDLWPALAYLASVRVSFAHLAPGIVTWQAGAAVPPWVAPPAAARFARAVRALALLPPAERVVRRALLDSRFSADSEVHEAVRRERKRAGSSKTKSKAATATTTIETATTTTTATTTASSSPLTCPPPPPPLTCPPTPTPPPTPPPTPCPDLVLPPPTATALSDDGLLHIPPSSSHTATLLLVRGHEKSGTTWLRALLNLHPAVYLAPREAQFNFASVASQKLVAEPWLAATSPGHAAIVWSHYRSLVTSVLAHDATRAFNATVRRHPDTRAPLFVGEKSPKPLRPLLPNARYVYILRDVRDVIVSLAWHYVNLGGFATWCEGGPPVDREVARTLAEFPESIPTTLLLSNLTCVESLTSHWVTQLTEDLATLQLMSTWEPGTPYPHARTDGFEPVGTTVHALKYEALVARIDEEVDEELFRNFLGLDPTLASPRSTNDLTLPGIPASDQAHSSFFRKGVVGDWRTTLSIPQCAVVHRLAYPLLEQLAYESDPDWHKKCLQP